MMLPDSPMMRAENPSFQVGENQVDHWQVPFRDVWIAVEHNRLVGIPQYVQHLVSWPSVSFDDCSRCHAVRNEGGKVFSCATGDNAEPKSPSIDKPLERDAAFMRLPVSGSAILCIPS